MFEGAKERDESPRPDASVVVPAWNEAQSIVPLARELSTVAKTSGLALEVIFVDDGSTDDTWTQILLAGLEDPRVVGIRFPSNRGKATALASGFLRARADVVVQMDADGQDDPSEIPALLRGLEEGLDLVNGWKKQRRDPWHRIASSKLFNWLLGEVSGLKLHDHNCGLKAMRKEVAEELELYGSRHRFIPVLADSLGYRVGEQAVNHRPRQYGKSKYGMSRVPRGLLDVATIGLTLGRYHDERHLAGR